MTVQAKYITSIIETFSTYLESLNVSTALGEETTVSFIKFLQHKKDYSSWTMSELEKFIETEKLGSNTAILIRRYIENFTPFQTDIFLHQFLGSLKFENKSSSTIKNYRSDISQFISLVEAKKITALFSQENIKKFVKDQFSKNLKASSVKRKLISIAQFAAWAENEKLIENVSFWISDVESLFGKKTNGDKSKNEAISSGVKTEESMKLGSLHGEKLASYQLDDFLVSLEVDESSKSTIKNYKSDISQLIAFTGDLRLTSVITQENLGKFISYQKAKDLKQNSIKRKIVSISQFAAWAEKRGDLKNVALWLNNLYLGDSRHSPVTNVPVTAPVKIIGADHNIVLKLKDHVKVIKNEEAEISQEKKGKRWLLPFPKLFSEKNYTDEKIKNNYYSNLKIGTVEKLLASSKRKTKSFLPYVNFAMFILFFLGLGYFGYSQFIEQSAELLAYPSTPVRPNRELSFQGRLTDTAQNPVTSATNMAFRLYDTGPGSGGVLLWNSSTCSVTPDQDGIFNVGLGDDCGAEITENVFTENSNVWLEVEVAAETLTPRQSIKTVAYALNSETIQGYPISATGAATTNSILFMDGAGQVVLGEVSPTLKATTGTFSIEAQALTLKTSSGSNGDIIFNPNGLGEVLSTGYFSAPGATFAATYAGGTSLVLKGGPSGTANIQEWQNSSGTPLSTISSAGVANLAGLTINSAYTFPTADGTANYVLSTNGSGTVTWADPAAAAASSIPWIQGAGILYPKNSTVDLLIGGQSTASAKFKVTGMNSGTPTASISGTTANVATYLTGEGTLSTTNMAPLVLGSATTGSIALNPKGTTGLFVDGAGNVGIGTTTPAATLEISQTFVSANTEVEMFRTSRKTSGTGSTGIGAYTSTYLQDAGGTMVEAGRLSFRLHDATNGANTASQFVAYTERETFTNLLPVFTAYSTSSDRYLCMNGIDNITTSDDDCFGMTIGSGHAINFRSLGANHLGLIYDNSINQMSVTAPSTDSLALITLQSTAIFFDAANNGADMYINPNGNVGIGTTTPLGKFDVQGAVKGKALSIFNETGDQDIITASVSGVTKFRVANDGYVYGERFVDNSNSSYYVDPAAGGSSALFAGNLGVGTLGPDARVDSLATSGEQLRLTYTDGSVYTGFTTNSGGDLTIIPSGGDISVTGNILPSVDDTYTLGSTSLRWQDIFLGPNTAHIGTSLTDEGTISYDTTGNILNFGTDSTANGDIAFFTDDLYLDKSAGRVGIGTTVPGFVLDVAGTASVDSLNINSAYTFPTADGTNTYVLTTNGSGTVSWAAQAGASLFTDAGTFTYLTSTTDDLALGGNTAGASFFYDASQEQLNLISTIGADEALYVSTAVGATASINLVNFTSSNALNTQNIVRIQNDSAGTGIDLNNYGSSYGIDIDNGTTGTNFGLYVRSSANAVAAAGLAKFAVTNSAFDRDIVEISNLGIADGLYINQSTTGIGRGLYAYSNVGVTATDSLAFFHANDIAFDQSVLEITNDGVGNALLVNNLGTGASFRVNDAVALDTTPFLIDESGNVGIGSTNPAFLLDVSGSEATTYISRIRNTNTTDTADGLLVRLDVATTATGMYFVGFSHSATIGGKIQGSATDNQVTYTTSGTDYAEYFLVNDQSNRPDFGDLITISDNTSNSVEKAVNNKHLLGVVTDTPGFVGNGSICPENMQEECDAHHEDINVLVGLTGQINTKVSNINGAIKQGDALTSSNIPGVAVKATEAGYIIGHALESFNANTTSKIRVMVYPSWYDPNMYFTSTGDLQIQGQEDNYTLKNTASNTIIEKIGAFSKIISANITAGIAYVKNLNADVLTVNQQLISPIANIDTLNSTNINVENEIKTNKLTAKETSLGSLLAQDATISGTLNVATISATNITSKTVETGTLLSDELNTLTASISGKLTADSVDTASISATNIDVTSARITALEAGIAQLESVKANTAEIVNATVSGTLYANNIYDFENKIATSLQKPGLLDLLTGQNNSTASATYMGELYATVNSTQLEVIDITDLDLTLEELSLTQDDVVLTATAMYVEKYFKVNGAGYISDSLAVGNSIFAGTGVVIGSGDSTTQITNGVIAYITPDPDNQILKVQPSGQGSIDLLAGLVIIDDSGKVTVNGNFEATGDVKVGGTLLANLIEPTDFGNPLQVQVAGVDTQTGEVKQSRFEIINEVGAPVATFSAQGRAEFAGGVGIGSEDLGSSAINELQSEKTSGKATIESGSDAVKIKSSLITEKSMIYVTAVGSTNNQVLYVKSQVPNVNTPTANQAGEFVVGFDSPTTANVSFNWWIVN